MAIYTQIEQLKNELLGCWVHQEDVKVIRAVVEALTHFQSECRSLRAELTQLRAARERDAERLREIAKLAKQPIDNAGFWNAIRRILAIDTGTEEPPAKEPVATPALWPTTDDGWKELGWHKGVQDWYFWEAWEAGHKSAIAWPYTGIGGSWKWVHRKEVHVAESKRAALIAASKALGLKPGGGHG